MAPEAYKAVNTHAYEISVCKYISRLLHACVPDVGGMNGGVRSYLATLELNNWEHNEFLIVELSYFNKKLFSLEKISPL